MKPSLPVMASLLVLVSTGACRRQPSSESPRWETLPQAEAGQLRPLDAFERIEDRGLRSQALFLEASRVFFHPRCANCHPDGDSPFQDSGGQPHSPPVTRGPEDRGVVGMECAGCHQDHNLELARVPGAPNWHLAPRTMAWVGKTPRQVCEQLKDPARNGGKTLAQLVEHNAHDELVGWGWNPGAGREPAPGTQAHFGRIVAAWVATGAECPGEEARP
ncbi:Isoquinoline 1-oxidoreductase subunit [Myxococcus sp. K15C18031901]|uniref:Isoquinoline 1-oxidoreductase subunit n=1 Tax=Myxococcus dinghuensis TaxID=2906761 RepID=UPI0020A6DD7E|nr:Isoquinoline 1-oxidoreductase subunit [Myxococcus dinghuensis]MCP3101534.1 Isoquinoline 1-oxidoreductase subunit [Myxococcus dinghuensis]